MVHGDGDIKIERAKNFGEHNANAAAEGGCLSGISLRKDEGKLVAADAEGRVRSAESLVESGRGGVQDFIATRMAVAIVHFLETVKIENHQTERMSVAAGAGEFLIESLVKAPAVLQSGERVGNSGAMKLFEFLEFQHDRDAKHAGVGQDIEKSSEKGNRGFGAL